jgi:hypothetical protein
MTADHHGHKHSQPDHDHDHAHAHDQDHAHPHPHDHQHRSGLRGWINTVFHLHSHSHQQQALATDRAFMSNDEGIRTVWLRWPRWG